MDILHNINLIPELAINILSDPEKIVNIKKGKASEQISRLAKSYVLDSRYWLTWLPR
jgi:hypothetical protein